MSSDKKTGAILTPSQREFLRNGPDKELSDASARMKRGRIENRIRTAIVEDAPLLSSSDDSNHPIAAERVAESAEPGEIQEGVRSLVELLYRVADTAGADPEKAIEDGMNRSRGERLDRILKKIGENPAATVSPDELQTLNDHGYLPDEAHSDLFKHWLGAGGNIDVATVREAMNRDFEE